MCLVGQAKNVMWGSIWALIGLLFLLASRSVNDLVTSVPNVLACCVCSLAALNRMLTRPRRLPTTETLRSATDCPTGAHCRAQVGIVEGASYVGAGLVSSAGAALSALSASACSACCAVCWCCWSSGLFAAVSGRSTEFGEDIASAVGYFVFGQVAPTVALQ